MKTILPLLALTLAAFAQQRPAGERPLPDGVVAKRDIEYVAGGGKRRMLDVFFKTDAEKPQPLIVWIHGGAWLGGSKDRCPAIPLLDDGFAVASVTYRFSQDAQFPAQIHDCKAAIRWLRAHAKELNIDPERIGVWGASAGGHLVALLGVAGDKKEWDKGENLDHSSGVQAVVNWFGPSNLLTMGAQSDERSRIKHDAPDSPESRLIGGAVQEHKDAARAASPVNYATKDDAPILHMHGEIDPVVPHAQSVELHAALERAGASTTLQTIAKSGHGDGGFRSAEALTTVREFFKKQLLK
jgi:acetyl esterase/lipase